MTEYQQEAFDGDTDFARYRWEAQTGETKTFDRWLAEVERAAAEKAWWAAESAFGQAHDSDNFEPWIYMLGNPYLRAEE